MMIIWNLKNCLPIGQPLQQQSDYIWHWNVAFSPDSEQLVISKSDEKTIVVRDVKTLSSIGYLKGHTEGVNWIAFHPNGKRLVSTSDDKTAIV